MKVRIYKITSITNNGEYVSVDICSTNVIYNFAEDIEKDFNEEEKQELKKLKKQKYSKWYIAKWILAKRDYTVEKLEFDTKNFYINMYDYDNN